MKDLIKQGRQKDSELLLFACLFYVTIYLHK